jgi:hypothetical protein
MLLKEDTSNVYIVIGMKTGQCDFKIVTGIIHFTTEKLCQLIKLYIKQSIK